MSESQIKTDSSEQDLDLSSLPSDVPCLLIPLSSGKLMLLPNSAVAEILPIASYYLQEDGPDWCVGNLEWRGLSIPLASLELMNEEIWQPDEEVTRVAVFNGCVNNHALPFYGVVIKGIPRLVRVSSRGLSVQEGELLAAEDMLVLVNGESAVIPNLSVIEEQLLLLQ